MSLPQENDSDGIANATMTPATATSVPTLEMESSTAPDLSNKLTNPLVGQSSSSTPDSNVDTTRQKIVDIIEHQFDLEILLRHAEGATIAQELAKAERMLEDLRHAILSERQGSPYGNSTVSRTIGGPDSHQSNRQSSRRTTAYYGRDVRQPEALYAVRADGQFVKYGPKRISNLFCSPGSRARVNRVLGCPKCDRYDFGSIQGLINHMRLSHKLVFKNTEEGVRYCGIVVPSSEVPLDHSCRTKIVFSSLGASDASHGQQDFPKPTIKTYDEDVDLESDDGRARNGSRRPPQLRKNSGASNNSSSNTGSESESDTSDVISAGESGTGAGMRRRSSLALSVARPHKGTPGSKVNGESDSDGTDDNRNSGNEAIRPPHGGKGPMRKYGAMSQGPSAINANTGRPGMTSRMTIGNYTVPDSAMSSAASSRATSPSLHPLMNETDISEPPTPIARFPPPSLPIPSQNTLANPLAVSPAVPPFNTLTGGVTNQHPQQLQPTIISFGATAIQGGVPAPLDTVGSRFYVKRRVVVGNVSKYLPEDKRDPRLKEFPYKWMIYVDGTPKPEEITAYVSKVEFHLHESYKPNHIITVSEPPFHLSRYAWGETQIKVRLFFHDARNKPVEVYHRLALDPTHCGRQVHGRERYVDLELDRNTTFKPSTPFQSRPKGSSSKSHSRNNLILNSAAEVAMADGAEEDEQELQKTLSRPAVLAVGAHGTGAESSRTGAQNGSRAAIDTVRAASIDDGPVMKNKVKETNLLFCKACGSFWKQHRDGALGVAGTASEPILLNEDNGLQIPNCPHHPNFYAVKSLEKDNQMLLSLLVGRTKNKFALDMLEKCGIVDQHGQPISNHDRALMEMHQQSDSAMDLDIGDSELLPSPSNPASLLTFEQQIKAQQLSEAFQNIEVYKCRRTEIDWVLSVMDELKLKTLFLDGGVGGGSGGSRSGLRERDQEQERLLNTPGLTKVPDSMSQRAVVGGLLVQATKAFLNSILSKATSIHRHETEAEKGPESIMMELDALNDSEGEGDKHGEGAGSGTKKTKVSDKLLAPYHIYQALQSNPEELDFLTSQYEDMEGIGEMMGGL
ncbi:YEATS domain-containing protein 2 [Entomortierella chlamydospora]|uniref:YEATS domain-containing protein 2 n=1 Tax=Entomortierella chlamydospora TaxID=101097 RepID=A0A9P6T2L0_9FUNG|nr:YEATS domain-containing protein 2 [Entomortierella chlamydospora]